MQIGQSQYSMTGARSHKPPDRKRRQDQVLESSANKTQAKSGLKNTLKGQATK